MNGEPPAPPLRKPFALAPDGIDGGSFRLRRWREEDREPFAASGQDAQVMRFFPRLYTRDECDITIDRFLNLFATVNIGPWVVEIPEETAFAGFVGVIDNRPELPLGTTYQIGWRLIPSAWGRGIATCAARLSLTDYFRRGNENCIVAYTAVANRPSQKVMERLGMRRDKVFAHPLVPESSPVRDHVLYRLDRKDFSGNNPSSEALKT